MPRVNCSILEVGTFGGFGAYFSLQLTSPTRFAKIKKLSPKIIVNNIKNRF